MLMADDWWDVAGVIGEWAAAAGTIWAVYLALRDRTIDVDVRVEEKIHKTSGGGVIENIQFIVRNNSPISIRISEFGIVVGSKDGSKICLNEYLKEYDPYLNVSHPSDKILDDHSSKVINHHEAIKFTIPKTVLYDVLLSQRPLWLKRIKFLPIRKVEKIGSYILLENGDIFFGSYDQALRKCIEYIKSIRQ